MSELRQRWQKHASDYFGRYAAGRYDDYAYLWFIYPENEIHEADIGSALFIGRAGGDGIEFAFRRDHPGIWAYYPIEQEWRPVAPDIESFEQEWLSRRLIV